MPASVALGSSITLTITTRDSAGALANVSTAALVITLPDGTTADVTPTNPSTGSYVGTYTTTQAGHHGAVWTTTGPALVFEDAFNVDDTAVSSPVSLTDVKEHLNITGTDDDAELVAFLNAATAAIEARVGPLTRRSVTEVHNGGVSAILLRQAPALAVTSVTENGAAVAGSGYSLSAGGGVLTRVSGFSRSVWTDGFGNVSVTYTAGRTSIPADLRQAVLELVRHLWSTQRGQMGRTRSGDDFVAGQGYTMPNRVLELISPYELPGLA